LTASEADAARRENSMNKAFTIHPIGVVHNTDEEVALELFAAYADGLLGLEQFSHISVLYWFHQNDNPEDRRTLQVHPRGNEANPLTGVFATHSPRRPNLIALTRCRILSVEDRRIRIDAIDAFDGTPVVDIKAWFPDPVPASDVRVPTWEGPKDLDE